MEEKFKKLMFTLILITLFAFLTIGFATQLADIYNKDTTEFEETMGATEVSDTLDATTAQSSVWTKAFESWGEEGTFKALLDIIGFFAVSLFYILRGMGLFLFTPFIMLSNIMTNIMGIPLIVSVIIQVLLTLSIIFGVWSLIKTGN